MKYDDLQWWGKRHGGVGTTRQEGEEKKSPNDLMCNLLEKFISWD